MPSSRRGCRSCWASSRRRCSMRRHSCWVPAESSRRVCSCSPRVSRRRPPPRSRSTCSAEASRGSRTRRSRRQILTPHLAVMRRNGHGTSDRLPVPRPREPWRHPRGVFAAAPPHEGTSVAKPVVLIAEQLSPATVEALGPDFDIRSVDGTDRAALLSALADASAVLIRSATQIDAEALAAAPALKVVARAGVGLDNVDIKAATEAGVMVVNAPTSNIISAAELTIGHILSLARHIPAAHASLVAGEWKRSTYTGTELYEKTVGIIGLGRIGALITARLQAFGVEVIAYDPYVSPARAQQLGVHLVSLDELLEQSDFITIHMPKTTETTGMIAGPQLARMKKTAYIVNVARGGLIDEAALAEALTDGTIAGAGLDVFGSEPPTDSALLGLPNVVVTPHLGASTDEAQEKAGVSVAKSVRLALEGE